MKRIYGEGGVKGDLLFFAAGASLIISAVLGQGKLADSMYGTGEAQEYVEQQGYTNLAPTDKDMIFLGFRGCADTDAVKYEFSATAPNGQPNVRVAICKGLFKSATVRQG